MALNIKNADVERPAGTEAVMRALVERRASLQEYMEHSVWPMVPAGELGRVMSREEEDRILGYGPEGS